MSLRAVGLVGSPRKGKNTDTLVRKALEGVRSAAERAGLAAEVEVLYLNDLDLRPCQACPEPPPASASSPPRRCLLRDDMDKVYDALEASDVVVAGSPAYYGTVSAQLKLVIDRSSCLAEMVTRLDGRVEFRTRVGKRKRGAFIWVADSSTDPGPALTAVRLWCHDANIDLVDTLAVTGSDRGEGARNRPELLGRAFQIGVAVAEAALAEPGPPATPSAASTPTTLTTPTAPGCPRGSRESRPAP